MTTSTAAISIQDLYKRFGKREVLHGINLNVERGNVFGVIGPNGAGKTTTIRILLDIIRPSSGTLRVLGQNPTRANAAFRSRIGYLPGELRLPPQLTAHSLLKHFASISGFVAQVASRRSLSASTYRCANGSERSRKQQAESRTHPGVHASSRVAGARRTHERTRSARPANVS